MELDKYIIENQLDTLMLQLHLQSTGKKANGFLQKNKGKYQFWILTGNFALVKWYVIFIIVGLMRELAYQKQYIKKLY